MRLFIEIEQIIKAEHRKIRHIKTEILELHKEV
jgi:hypothetical protein